MKSRRSRTDVDVPGWPKKITSGHVTVTVYRRKTPKGGQAFMVANYSAGQRRFDCYPTEAKAVAEAEALAGKLSGRQLVAAGMTNKQASDYAAAAETLAPFNVSLPSAASILADCLKIVGGLSDVLAASKYYGIRHKKTVAKRVQEVVDELLMVKEARKASKRYLEDLRYRLNRFGEAFQKDAWNVTTPEIQAWIDKQKLSPQSYQNFRRVIHLLFKFALARGYASDNPATGVERVEIRGRDVRIFKPEEIERLLAASSPDFRPCLALGAFAGLRSAEIERLEWSDIDLQDRHIVIGASKAKTACRRVVPVSENLVAWLAPYADMEGKVWTGTHDEFYEGQQVTAAATAVVADDEKGIKTQRAVAWKANGLRHSYASYRFAQTADAGRVAGELGNSAAIVHRHYRELVKPTDAEKWFAVKP